MDEGKASRPVTTSQVVAIIVFTLALFFAVAFATKLGEAYRLKNWRDQLEGEIAQMERQKEELEAQIKHRQSRAWADKVLREAGWLPEGAVRVIVVTSTPNPAGEPTPTPTPTETGSALGTEETVFFHNPNWKAWQRLIFGFDKEGDLYYNTFR